MKFARPIKFFQIGCVAAVIASGALHIQAQTPPPVITNVDFPAIGTPEKLEAFAVHTVDLIIVWSWYYDTNGNLEPFHSVQWNKTQFKYTYGPLTNKTELDDTCRDGITISLNDLVTNTDPDINKDQGLYVYVSCDAYNGHPAFDTFYAYYTHLYLVKNGNTYSLPDLSGLSPQINNNIPLYIPNLQWARYEIGNTGNQNPFEVDDERLNPSTDPIGSDGFLWLPTDLLSNSSTTNGTYWIKISALAKGGFYVWNGDGTRVPETPFVLNLTTNQSGVSVIVSGGDSGRGYALQSSADLTAWTNCSAITFVPTNAPPNLAPAVFAYPATNRSLFFRTATTNLPPM
jgi:hypothetical protein